VLPPDKDVVNRANRLDSGDSMKAQLVVIHGKPRDLARTLEPGECLIGRGEECHIRTSSPWVSRQHCLLRVTANEVFLHDLGSTNGTLVNGKRVIGERLLQSGDLLQIGVLVLELRVEADSAQMIDTKRISGQDTKISADDAPRLDPAEAEAKPPQSRADAESSHEP
jgi:pSer/pThr/pTyr-binding forkhead associated (FHA) protein